MLEKQVIPIVLDQGIDQSVDSKISIPGRLTVAENAVFRKRGKIQKSNGSTKLGQGVIGNPSVALSGSVALGVFGSELLQFNEQTLYSYSEQSDIWAGKGAAISARIKTRDIFKNDYEQTQVDIAVTNNIGLVAWEDTRGGIRCSVYDYESDMTLASDVSVHATATRPRCISFNGYLFLFYVNGNDLLARKISPANPLPLATEVTVVSGDLNSSTVAYDIITQDEYMACAYNKTGSNQIILLAINDALTATSSSAIAEAGKVITLVRGAMSRLFVCWHATGTVRVAVRDVFLASYTAPFTLDNTAGTVTRITGYLLEDESAVRFFYEYSAAATYNTIVRQNTATDAGSAGTSAVFKRSVGLASKAFLYGDSGFVTLVHDSDEQPTFFIVRDDGYIAGKLQPGNAGGLLTRNLVSNVAERESGVFAIALLACGNIISEGEGRFLSLRGAVASEIDFSGQSTYFSAEVEENFVLAGGVISSYDGNQVVEQGFHLFPENISLVEGTGGSLELTGTYAYQVCFEWTDAKNRKHRSAPSDPIQQVLTSSNNKITLTIPTLRMTGKSNVIIGVYRTETLGDVYYRVTSISSPTYNDPTVDTISFVDTLSDAALILRDQLYTTGGILENIAPPAASVVVKWQDRAVLVDAEDGQVWPSKHIIQGFAAEFNDSLVFPAEKIGGDAINAAVMDEKLVLFRERAIQYTSGDGPDNTGGSQSFLPFVLLSDAHGLKDINSVALAPQGLVFKGRQGFFLIGRDTSLRYIGDKVKDFNSLTVTSAVVIGDLNEIHFSTDTGPTLVWNYEFERWSTIKNRMISDATLWRGQYVFIKDFSDDSSFVAKEDRDSFREIDQSYAMAIETDWLTFSPLIGLQRIRRLLLLGDWKSPHKLRVRFAYDYSPVWTDTFIWEPDTALEKQVYGDGDYGDGVYGGAWYPYIARIRLSRQKSAAVKIRIEDITQDDASYESFVLNALAFEAGVKKGAFKTHRAATL